MSEADGKAVKSCINHIVDYEGIGAAAGVYVQILNTVNRLYHMCVVVDGDGNYLAQ